MSIHAALAEAAGRIGGLAKTETNKEQGFMFRSIDAVLAHAKPVFADLGISVVPSVLEKDYQEVQSSRGTRGWRCTVTMQYVFSHKDGSSVVTSMAGEAIDYGDKSTTKAEQMAYKYVLTQVLMIGATEADPDGESPEAVVVEPPLTPTQWVVNQIPTLEGWNKTRSQRAWKAAVEALAVETPLASMEDAELVWGHMLAAWEEDTKPFEEEAK